MSILASILFSTLAAQAGSFCIFSDDYLAQKNNSCGVNEVYYGAAAVECVENFRREADRVSQLLAATMIGGKNNAIKGVHKQDDFHGSAEANYQSTKKRLEALIADGQASMQVVEGYLPNLSYPEDYFRNPTRQYLESQPCYIDNVKLLKTVLRDFQRKLDELEHTYAVAFQRKNQSQAYKNGMEARAPSAILHGTGRGPASVPGGTSPRHGSDITGVKPEKKLPN